MLQSMQERVPNFNMNFMVAQDLLEDWLFIISEDNSNRLREIPESIGLFTGNKAVEFIFSVCDRLKLSAEIRHAAISLYDAFMLAHIESMYNYTYENSDNRAKVKNWQSLEDKIGSQITLRVLSCIQIASKLYMAQNCLTLTSVKEFLRKLGHCYTSENVLNSEIRILKTLNYKVNVLTPLDFIETLLKLMQAEDSELDVTLCYEWCVNILDLIALNREEIYTRLIESSLKSCVFDRRRLVWIENDYMILAAAVITTAQYTLYGLEQAEKIAISLNGMTRVPAEDVTDFCTIIVDFVISNQMSFNITKNLLINMTSQ